MLSISAVGALFWIVSDTELYPDQPDDEDIMLIEICLDELV